MPESFSDTLERMRKETEVELNNLRPAGPPAGQYGVPNLSDIYNLGNQALTGMQQTAPQAMPPPVAPAPLDPALVASHMPEPPLQQLQSPEPAVTAMAMPPLPGAAVVPEPQAPSGLYLSPDAPQDQMPDVSLGQAAGNIVSGALNFFPEAFRQIHDSLTIDNAKGFGTFARDMGRLGTDPYLEGVGNTLIGISESTPRWNKNQPLNMTDLFDQGRPPGSTASYVAQTAGNLVGSMTYMGGALLGGTLIGGPQTGKLAAFGAAFGMNYGDVRDSIDQLAQEQGLQISEKEKILGSLGATLPIAGLDVLGAETMGVLPLAGIKKDVLEKVVAAVTSRYGKAGVLALESQGEGLTEFAQQMVQEAYLAIYDKNPDWGQKFVNGINAWFAGSLGGLGVAMVNPHKPEPPPLVPPEAPPPTPIIPAVTPAVVPGPEATGPQVLPPISGPSPPEAPPGTTPSPPVEPPPPPTGPEAPVPGAQPAPPLGPPEAPPGTAPVEGPSTPAEPPTAPVPPVGPPAGPQPAAPLPPQAGPQPVAPSAPITPTVPVVAPQAPPIQFSKGPRYIVTDASTDLSLATTKNVRLMTAAETEHVLGQKEPGSVRVFEIDSAKLLPGRLSGSMVSYAYAAPFLAKQLPEHEAALQAALAGATSTVPHIVNLFESAKQQLFGSAQQQMYAVKALQNLDTTLEGLGIKLPPLAGTLQYNGPIHELANHAKEVNPLDIDYKPSRIVTVGGKGLQVGVPAGWPEKVEAVLPRLPMSLTAGTTPPASFVASNSTARDNLRDYIRYALQSYGASGITSSKLLAIEKQLTSAILTKKKPSTALIESAYKELEVLNVPFSWETAGTAFSQANAPMPTAWLGSGFPQRGSNDAKLRQLEGYAAQLGGDAVAWDAHVQAHGKAQPGGVVWAVGQLIPADAAMLKVLDVVMKKFLPGDKVVYMRTNTPGQHGSWRGTGWAVGLGPSPTGGPSTHVIPKGWHVIEMSDPNMGQMARTLLHEVMHGISYKFYSKLPSSLVKQAYNAWRLRTAGWVAEGRGPIGSKVRNVSGDLDWYGFHEWFTTQMELKIPENEYLELFKAWPRLRRELQDYYADMNAKFGWKMQPDAIFADIMANFQGNPTVVPNATSQAEGDEAIANAKWLPGVEQGVPYAEHVTAEMARSHPQVAALSSFFNWRYKWQRNLLQLAEANSLILPLQKYVEHIDGWNRTRMHWMNKAAQRKREWEALGPKQGQAVSDLLFEVQKMLYVAVGAMPRYPTAAELHTMATAHGVNTAGMDVYNAVVKDFKDVLQGVRDTLLKDALRVHAGNPAKILQIQNEIMADFAKLGAKPYFPYARFGRYHVVLVDKRTGKTNYREGFESERQQQAAVKRLATMALPNESVALRTIPDEFVQFMGLPPQLLDKIATQMTLTPAQAAQLKELTYELSPAHSFNKHFIRRDSIGGYSTDGIRVYADYFFHAANHMARIEHGPKLDDDIKSMQVAIDNSIAAGDVVNANKADQIKQYMSWHKADTMNPNSEWHALRGMAFLWNFMLEPLSGAMNLMQTPMVTAPFLARRFGDWATNKELLRASLHLKGLYTSRTTSMTRREHEMIAEAIDQGFIDQSFAEDLAGLANGGSFAQKWFPAGETAEKYFKYGLRYAVAAFHHAERAQRFITALATFRMAQQQGLTKYGPFLGRHQELIASLVGRGWTQVEAEAFAAAKETVQQTHFENARWAKPRLFRGKKSSLLVFQNFSNNLLWIVEKHPEKWRVMLGLVATSGLMGLPFGEDIADLIKMLGYWGGKQFDPEKEATLFLRKFTDNPDLFLHGFGRYGLGMEFIGDATGWSVPSGDVSGRLGMGRMIPGMEAATTAMSGATEFMTGKPAPYAAGDVGDLAGKVVTNASGAAFGMVGSFMNAFMHMGDPNAMRYVEQALPRAFKNGIAAYRMARDGEATTVNGSPLITYDVKDPHDLAEIAAQAIGATPRRLVVAREEARWVKEQMAWLEGRRGGLVEQLWQRVQTGDKDGQDEVLSSILDYNDEVADLGAVALVLTKDDLRDSLKSRAKGEAFEGATGEKTKSRASVRGALERLYGMETTH